MTIVTIEYKKFNDWDIETQTKILEKYQDINTDFEWWEPTIETIVTALELLGWYDVKVYFSGFYSQGDGAQFNGRYSYNKGALTQVKKDYPKWKELQDFAEQLQLIQKRNFYGIHAIIKQNGRYSHENCTSFYIEHDKQNDLCIETEQKFIECCKDFMKNIYSVLEEECDYLTSEAVVKDTLINNEYEFNELGEIL